MHAEETKGKGDKTKSDDSGFASMGQRMFEMMSNCCGVRGGFPDCSTPMEGMMEAMKKQHCTPDKDAAESERRKK